MPPHWWEQVLAVPEAKPSKELIPVFKKLYQNSGHPLVIWCISSVMARLPQKKSMWPDTLNATFVKAGSNPKFLSQLSRIVSIYSTIRSVSMLRTSGVGFRTRRSRP
jgi:hypothetical protein